MEKTTVTFKAYEMIEKEVKKGGSSGQIYLPKEWVGKKVKVCLIEPVND